MNEKDRKIARAGDTFPCGIDTPHEDHLHRPEPGINIYRCDGDTDTRSDRLGRRNERSQ